MLKHSGGSIRLLEDCFEVAKDLTLGHWITFQQDNKHTNTARANEMVLIMKKLVPQSRKRAGVAQITSQLCTAFVGLKHKTLTKKNTEVYGYNVKIQHRYRRHTYILQGSVKWVHHPWCRQFPSCLTFDSSLIFRLPPRLVWTTLQGVLSLLHVTGNQHVFSKITTINIQPRTC